jgi:hypothetical protein
MCWAQRLFYVSVVLNIVCFYASCIFMMTTTIMTKWFYSASRSYRTLNYLQWTTNVHPSRVQQRSHLPTPPPKSHRVMCNDIALYQNGCYWKQDKWSLTFKCFLYHVLYILIHVLYFVYHVSGRSLPLMFCIHVSSGPIYWGGHLPCRKYYKVMVFYK